MPLAPNLVIQQQRMGDLVLSFPLFAWLGQIEPDRPLWVVAEKTFFQALVPLAPSLTFFEPQAAEALRGVRFHRVINLSHRPEAARLAGGLESGQRLGRATLDGLDRIAGPWHLYRASLVHNNRHNLMHWADLNALDLVPPHVMQRSVWPLPRQPKGNGRIGLFVGASEPAKRPDAEFWGLLARELGRRDCKPVFLGGEAEKELGASAARMAGMPRGNLCGRFSLAELTAFLQELDLLITPDTGPMHVGAWAGTLILNLSMGPVNAWETAPFPPGHLVLRPASSCVGCWRCFRDEPPCRARFQAARVASLAHGLCRGGRPPSLPGLQLLRTLRSDQGLFQLETQHTAPHDDAWDSSPAAPRYALGDFWRQWFLARLGGPPARPGPALDRLDRVHPAGSALLKRGLPRLQAALTLAMRRNSLDARFWLQAPPALRPLSGYMQLALENADFSRQAWRDAVEHLEHLSLLLG